MSNELALPGPDVPVFDTARLEEEFGGDAEIVAELRDLFLEHAPVQYREIQAALATGDAGAAAKVAHSLKGACATFGAPRLAQVCKCIELLCKAGELDVARGHGDDLTREYEAVFAAIGAVGAV